MMAIIKIGLLVLSIPVFFFVRTKFKMKDDSSVEQMIEAEIKEEVGLDIDLSPEEEAK